MILQQIHQQIKTNQRFLVVAHENPDGDAIGSTLGLALALRDMGKDVVAFNIDGVPDIMGFIPDHDFLTSQLAENARFDVAFVLDSGDLRRTGIDVAAISNCIINIDHHPHSDFGDFCYLDTTASATAALIFRLLQECGYQLSSSVAKNLYLGILSDTGSFRYSSANREAFDIAGCLVGHGVDPWEMASSIYESYPPQRMRLLALVLPTLELSTCGRYASVSMLREDLTRSGATEEHADGFVNYPRAVRGVEVALFFSQVEPELFKVSFRSRGKIDVGSLARYLGGGGHHNAAGAKVAGTLDAAKANVYNHLDRLFA